MLKIKLTDAFLELDGREVIKPDTKEVFTLGQILANQLVAGTKGEALKYYDWAVQLVKGQEIEMSEADLRHIIKFVEDCDTINLLSKAQLIRALEKFKPAAA